MQLHEKERVWVVYCLHTSSIKVNFIDYKRKTAGPDRSATSLKRKMMYRIATQFPYRLWLLLGMILRNSCHLTFGLALVVGSTFDIPQNFGWPSERFFLNSLVECSNLMQSGRARSSSTCKSDLHVPICPSLYTMLHTIQFLLVIDGTADPSKISLEFLCNF